MHVLLCPTYLQVVREVQKCEGDKSVNLAMGFPIVAIDFCWRIVLEGSNVTDSPTNHRSCEDCPSERGEIGNAVGIIGLFQGDSDFFYAQVEGFFRGWEIRMYLA